MCGLCCQVGQESGFSPVVGLTGVWCELTVCGLLSGRTGGRLLACRWSNWCVVQVDGVCGLCCQVGQEAGFSPVVGLTGVWCELTVWPVVSSGTGGRLLACHWSNWCVV